MLATVKIVERPRRFKREDTKVARTEQVNRHGREIVTIDYDRIGEPIGVELLGVVEFSIVKLLELAQVRAPNADLNRARDVGAGHLERELATATG
jgi:hypothetical protein